MGYKDQAWKELFYNQRELLLGAQELAQTRGEALMRVWVGIDACVDDPDLANTLRLLIIGDFIPDLVVVHPISEELSVEEDESS